MDLKEAFGKIDLLQKVVAECHRMMAKKEDIHQDLMKDYQHSKMLNTFLNDKLHKMESQLVHS